MDIAPHSVAYSQSQAGTSVTGSGGSTIGVSTANWPNTLEAYQVVTERPSSAKSCRVFASTCVEKDTVVCLKQCDLEMFDAEKITQLMNDIYAMRSFKHENIVRYYTSFVSGSSVCLVTELMEHGSLETILRGQLRSGLEEPESLSIIMCCLRAMEYLHAAGHIHRNVKTRHIMLNQAGEVRLSNFSVSTWLVSQGRQKAETLVGSPAWMAPEVAELSLTADSGERGYNAAADIWALGITAIELATGNNPYSKFPPMKVVQLILESAPPLHALGDNCSSNFRDFVAQCLQKDPTKRPTATKLLKHAALKGLRKKAPEVLAAFAARVEPYQTRIDRIQRERAHTTVPHADLKALLSDCGSGASSSEPTTPRSAKSIAWEFDDDDEEDASTTEQDAPSSQTASQPPAAAAATAAAETITASTAVPVALSAVGAAPSPAAAQTPVDAVAVSPSVDLGSHLIPLDCWVGETESDYVVFLRTIAGTPLSFRLHDNTLQITGKLPDLPDLPDLPGVRLLQTYASEFQHDLEFPKPIDKAGVSPPVMMKNTMVMTLPKKT